MGTTLARSTLADRAADAILTLIVEEDLQVDESLPAAGQLATRFGVSVVVVREAIAALAGRGILTRRQGRETIVARPGAEVLDSILRIRMRQDRITVDEFQQCRAALEGQSAVLASHVGDAEHRGKALAGTVERLAEARDRDAYRDADLAFHLALATLAGNQALLLLLEALNTVVAQSLNEMYRRVTSGDEQRLARVVEHHARIRDAVVAGHAQDALAAMVIHFEESAPDVDFGLLSDELLPPHSDAESTPPSS